MLRYSTLMTAIAVLNAAIIFTLSWSAISLTSFIFNFQGIPSVDIGGQPLMILLCILFSTLNTPLIAVPFIKYPERAKTTILYAVIVPFVVMTVSGLAVIVFAALETMNVVLG